MSSTPLPRQVDIRKLIAADTEISVQEPLQKFARLAAMLEMCDGDVEVKLHFYVDEGGNKRIDGEVHTDVTVLCQRCLRPLNLPINSIFAVAAVWSDDQASRLPRDLEPYIVGEGPQDIRDLIEDELILCIPYAAYHDLSGHERKDCADGYRQSVTDEIDAGEKKTKPNPFQVLEQLKSSKKSE